MRASETLADARRLREAGGNAHSVLNRLYYAAFYAVGALLLTENLSTRKHSGVRSLFAKHFVNAGRVSKECGETYYQLFATRQSADYEDLVVFEPEEVEDVFARTESLVQEILLLMDNQGI